MPQFDATRDNTRRSLGQLKTLHNDLEPGLRDIYVEGRGDVIFYARFLRECGVPFDGIYAVDDRAVVPGEAVRAVHQEVGAKGRLIALAAEVSTWESSQGVTCIIDRDFDCFQPIPEFDSLLRTDLSSRELYGLQPGPFSRFVELGLGIDCPPEAAERLIETLVPALNELFLARAALHLGSGVGLIERFMTCCTLKRGVLTVDATELVTRSLARAGESAQRERVLAKMAELRRSLPADLRLAIRGHDVGPVVAAQLGLKNDYAKPAVLESIWGPAIGLEDVVDSELFSALRLRLS